MSDNQSLSGKDVAKLLQDPSAENRIETAEKVAGQFGAGHLSDEERALAEDIFRVMVRDAEIRVRQALAENLKNSSDLSHEVAYGLANDVADVAAPILECSDVLTEEDLLEIVQSRPAEHQIAVAKRQTVSSAVSSALVEGSNVDVVATLMENNGAEISEQTFQKVLDDHGDDARVNRPMAHRNELPVNVSERLVNLVSDALKEHLVTHHAMSPDTATDLILQSRERATLTLVEGEEDQKDSVALAAELHRNGRLSSTIILRSVCLGDFDFFEAALAELCDIPVINAHRLIYDKGELGLKALYDKSGLPGNLFPMVRTAIDVMREIDRSGGRDTRQQFREVAIARILTACEDNFDDESFEYLMKKLGEHQSAAA